MASPSSTASARRSSPTCISTRARPTVSSCRLPPEWKFDRLAEPLEPPPVSPARAPSTDWGELVQIHFRPRHLSGVARQVACDRHPQPLNAAGRQGTTKPRDRRTRRYSAQKTRKTPRQGKACVAATLCWGPGIGSTRLTSRSSAHELCSVRGSAVGRAVINAPRLSPHAAAPPG